jgi:hypothetical protein
LSDSGISGSGRVGLVGACNKWNPTAAHLGGWWRALGYTVPAD